MTGLAAGFTPNMLPGFFFGLISLWVSGCGNRCDRPGLIVDADVGVLHRHADVAMAGQLTGFDKGCTVTQQLGDECFHVLIKLTQLLADHQLREFFEPING